ncbi:MAG: (Fe-S)-binding protein [Planctomycetaceae bacterium]
MSETPIQHGQTIDYTRFLDCVHCGLCTSACPTYLETGNENDGPRGRIYLMRAVVDGRIELTESVRGHLDGCLDCRSCETACPSGVQYGRLLEPFRAETEAAEAEVQKPDWFQRWIIHGLFPYASRLEWTLKPMRLLQKLKLDRAVNAVGLPKLLPARLRRLHEQLPQLQPREKRLPTVLPAIGERRARVGLFTGCVAEAMFSGTNRATARVLQQNGCEVVVPREQGCCGAIHYHSGAADPAMDFARQNLEAFADESLDAVIVNVAGCGSMLKDYKHIARELGQTEETVEALGGLAAKIRDVNEFLDELGLIAPTGRIPFRAVYHDACHLQHAQQVREQPRRILRSIPGLEVLEPAESEICCGAAGSYALTQPEMAHRLGRRKTDKLLATEPQIVVTANAGCSLQLQAHLRQDGAGLPVFHPIELLDMSYRDECPKL